MNQPNSANLPLDQLHLDPEDAFEILQQQKRDKLRQIQNKFDVLADRTINFATSKDGIFKGLLVTGPAGIGKSITIEQALKQANKITGKSTYELVKGKVSEVGLYAALYKNRMKNRIMWFDDVSGILDSEGALEILKAATSRQHEPRTIQWMKAQSTFFRDNNIPNKFNYEGHIIISTNKDVNPASQTKKYRDHFSALTSRMPPTDLFLNKEDAYIWTQHLITDCEMLGKKCISLKGGYSGAVISDTLGYLKKYRNNLHELTPRIADAIAGARHEWGPEKGFEKTKWLVVADETTGRFVENGVDND
jgi:hypothetical protein